MATASTIVDRPFPEPAPRGLPWRGYVPILLVALLGLGASLGLYHEVTHLEQQRVQTLFTEAARDRILVIRRELRNSLNLVQDIGSFFDTTGQVRRRQFREFVQPVLKRDPSVLSLEWVPVVVDPERDDFVLEAGVSFPRFRIVDLEGGGGTVSAARRNSYFPLLYVQPYKPDTTLLGLDLGNVPEESVALERARAAGRMWVEERRSWLPGLKGGMELAVYLPIYWRAQEADAAEPGDPVVDGIEPGQRRLRGFAIGRFAIAELVDQALSNLSPSGVDMEFQVAEVDRDAPSLHFHVSRIRQGAGPDGTGTAGSLGDWRQEDTIEVENRRWRVVSVSVPGRYQPGIWNARVVLLAGVAFTALFVVYLYTLTGRAEQVKHLVSLRTLELQRANRELNRQVGDRVRAERALQRLNATLEQRVARRTGEAERRAAELEQFAYVASHDLKAPLRAIANLAEWLGDDLADRLTEETREQLRLLRDRVARMHHLIEGLLTYSRVGRTAGSAEAVDSAVLVAETIDSLDPPQGFTIEVGPGMPTLVTDRLQLGQVFANLLSNGIKHHGGERGRIRVWGRDLGESCEFEVSDDGPGIAPEYHRKIFLMFQTLQVKDYASDTGIGLALVKKIVEEHGGAIEVSSEEGKGARFRFTWGKEKGNGDG